MVLCWINWSAEVLGVPSRFFESARLMRPRVGRIPCRRASCALSQADPRHSPAALAPLPRPSVQVLLTEGLATRPSVRKWAWFKNAQFWVTLWVVGESDNSGRSPLAAMASSPDLPGPEAYPALNH